MKSKRQEGKIIFLEHLLVVSRLIAEDDATLLHEFMEENPAVTEMIKDNPENVRRSFFVTDIEQNSYLYSISSRGMKVNALLDLHTDLAAIPLPVYDWDDEVLY